MQQIGRNLSHLVSDHVETGEPQGWKMALERDEQAFFSI
jgi:hypothetical protein